MANSFDIDDIDAILESAAAPSAEPLEQTHVDSEPAERHRPVSSRRSRSRSPRRHRHHHSHRRHRSRSPRRSDRRYSRSFQDGSPDTERSRNRSQSPFVPRPPKRELSPVLSDLERDRRTVFVQQLAARLQPRDLEEFFSQIGKVRQVKIVSDRITGRSKG